MEIVQAAIDPQFLTVPETSQQWPDGTPLIDLGEEGSPQFWTLKNAFEGVLVMGATGSGKTTGSGAAIAEAFLRSGLGGLVMTVKEDEAERWRRLCAHCGREGDLVVVRRGGEWKLNVLAYESQAPGGGGLSDNLVAFCRTLLAISSRNQGQGINEQFWQTASDQLLNATFDLFLLSGSQPTFDGLSNFIAAAPTDSVPSNEEAWLKIPLFGGVLAKAKELAISPEDKRILQRATGYWLNIYPGLAARTRTSITLGVYSMLDAFRGRDVPDLISSDTNVTPESIMAGKIVVLDLPLKKYGHTGLMVQSAWKYLFQTALERHSRSGDPRKRPVWLWEDEGQYFFSEHDHHFQATARSARVCHVVLSQNVHNFYMQFGQHGAEAANSVFGNLNTKIFHANSDPATNEWAARHFGQELRTRVSISHQPPPPRPEPKDAVEAFSMALNSPQTAGVTTTEQWEYAVRPEEFNTLRTGGPENDFQVDAYLTWVGAIDGNEHHFSQITFNQNPNL
jgi:type IV secretory pathway TraG/TraD family ATPase VirD4